MNHDGDGDYIAVAPQANIAPGRSEAFRIGPYDILVVNVGGTFYAVENRCSHMALPLAGGRLMGHALICPHHSAQFDVRTGAPLGFPANRPIRRFAVKVEQACILVAAQPAAM